MIKKPRLLLMAKKYPDKVKWKKPKKDETPKATP